jgi:tetratricopeptide (TPR) repeat protein
VLQGQLLVGRCGIRFQTFTTSAVLCVLLLSADLSLAQNTAPPNPEREHAFELYKQGKLVDAMPLLEKLSADNPKDIAAVESWGVSVLGYAQTLDDLELRKKARARAYSILMKAQSLGDNSDLLRTILRPLPSDGSFAAFSQKKDVDQAMQQAEADFARGDLDKAREGYMRAYLLDPKQYYTALFMGDAYFKQRQPTFAGEWFSNAIKIDPNVETAHRYWGDTLLGVGKLDEARSQYIEAIIADPYNAASWGGLKNWTTRTKLQLSWLKLKDRVAVEVKDGKTNVTLDNSLSKDDPSMGGWLSYGVSRALWMREKFSKEYPTEPSYRHSLREETESLHLFIAVVKEVSLKEKRDLSGTDLDTLARIEQAGLLEPFVLLNRSDNGIAKDYEGYRAANREKIGQYLDEFVVPKTPSPPTSTQN